MGANAGALPLPDLFLAFVFRLIHHVLLSCYPPFQRGLT